MRSIGPNTALALVFSGILGVYLECLRPGTIIAGCAGLALLLWGGYSLYTLGPTSHSCLLLLLSIVLFSVEVWRDTRFVSPSLATIALFAGFKELLPGLIQWGFALSLAVVLGVATAVLCKSAREARQKKWADLAQR